MNNQGTIKDLLRSNRETKADEPALDMGPIKSLFPDDERLPHIDESQVGKIRLLELFAKKFGAGFRSIPEVKDALEHYNKEASFLKLYRKTVEANRGR